MALSRLQLSKNSAAMNKEKIREQYEKNEEIIEERLQEFRNLRDAPEKRLFKELVFVILTSQSGAKKSWEATEKLEENSLLEEGSREDIAEVLAAYEVQYERNKAQYIVNNREKLSQPTLTDPEKSLKIHNKISSENLDKSREWFAQNIKGISWKGSSHFLRNIGYGDDFAIVSSHIVDVLYQMDILESTEQPKDKEEYLNVEEKMRDLSQELEIDIQALDLVLWSMKTGEVFK